MGKIFEEFSKGSFLEISSGLKEELNEFSILKSGKNQDKIKKKKIRKNQEKIKEKSRKKNIKKKSRKNQEKIKKKSRKNQEKSKKSNKINNLLSNHLI